MPITLIILFFVLVMGLFLGPGIWVLKMGLPKAWHTFLKHWVGLGGLNTIFGFGLYGAGKFWGIALFRHFWASLLPCRCWRF